jgi:hypothetical protein
MKALQNTETIQGSTGNASLLDDPLHSPKKPSQTWPERPAEFSELLTPVEAAQYLRLDETEAHTPESAIRTLNYWRQKGELKATRFARRVWFRKAELERFLVLKTEA